VVKTERVSLEIGRFGIASQAPCQLKSELKTFTQSFSTQQIAVFYHLLLAVNTVGNGITQIA